MKRQLRQRPNHSRSRSQTSKSCPPTRRPSLSSGETSAAPLNLEALNDGLISIIECPVCFETMLPPIFQCKEGHNVCSTCREKLKNCPLCRQVLVGRNVTVEHISNKLLRHCIYQEVGCKELVTLDNKERHEKICHFRSYECLPGKSLNCLWSGPRFEILGHMKSSHPEMANIGREDFDLYKWKHEISVVPALDEVFWFHLKRDPRKKILSAVVVYIGSAKNAHNYQYEFTIYSRKNGNKVSFTFETPSDTTDIDALIDRGEAAVMNFKTVKPFIDEKKKLPWNLRIKLVNECKK